MLLITPEERERIAERYKIAAARIGREEGSALGTKIPYEIRMAVKDIPALLQALAAVEVRAHNAEGLLAGLADCINQELRENGPIDVPQVTGYLGAEDMRHFVRLLVDEVKQRQAKKIAAVEAERDEKERFVQGYYGEAAEGWGKFRAAERELALLRPFASAAALMGLIPGGPLHTALQNYRAWQRTQE